jgi:PPK2 family polyphosphate:nucleotide phosphotransferase
MVTRSEDFARPYRVEEGRKFRLKDVDPGDTGELRSKEEAREWLATGVARLAELQERLYAQDSWAVLLIFQAMDAAGKDGVIEHVMSGVNPQGCQVYSFKAPSAEEVDHDFMWRTTKCLPERGRIGVFNRSYYEEVLVVRVHPEFLEGEKLPRGLVTDRIWKERFEDINAFERYVTRQGIAVLKFFLNVSREEQRRRFLARLDEPEKNWKFSLEDVSKRALWDKYMAAYEDMIANTSTEHAPWHVIPADKKWFMRTTVAETLVAAMEALDPKFPTLSEKQKTKLEEARSLLTADEKLRRSRAARTSATPSPAPVAREPDAGSSRRATSVSGP